MSTIMGKAAISVLSLLAAIFIAGNETGVASEVQKSCRAVDKIANITLSSKLVLSMASDEKEKTCDFFVSLPPPNSARASVDNWFRTAAKLDTKNLVEIVSDLAIAPIQSGHDNLVQALRLRIANNSDVVTTCVAKLIEKLPYEGKSKDGQLRCDVSGALEQAVFVVDVGDRFSSTVALPRPA